MKKLVPLVLVLALLLVGTTVVSAGSPIVHRVTVGSPDACYAFGLQAGCDANQSLVAIGYADGSVQGEWIDRWLFNASGDGFHAVIDCLHVEGNEAWLSGVITQGTFTYVPSGEVFDGTGWAVAIRVKDNGTSADDPPDQISVSYIDDDAFSCDEAPEVELLDTPQGQVKVR